MTIQEVKEITEGIDYDIKTKHVEGLALAAQLLLSRLIDAENKIQAAQKILNLLENR